MISRFAVLLSILLMAGSTVEAAELEIPTKKHKVAPGYPENPTAKRGQNIHAQREKSPQPTVR